MVQLVKIRALAAVVAMVLLAPAAASSPGGAPDLPPEPCVLAVRTARIALETGDTAAGLARLKEAAVTCGARLEPYLLVLELPEESGRAVAAEIEKIERRADSEEITLPLATLALAVANPRVSKEVVQRIAVRLEKRVAGGDRDSTTLRVLATAQARLGLHGPLEKTLQLVVATAPDPWARWALARLAMGSGHWKVAEKQLTALSGDDGLGFLARLALLKVYGATGNAGKAVELASRLSRDAGDSILVRERVTRTLLDAAWAAWDRGDAGGARRLFEQVLTVAPDDREAHDALRLVLVTPAEREAAQRSRMEHLVEGGNGPKLLEEGTKLLATGDAAAAWPLLDRGTRAEPSSAIGWYNLGLASQQLERWKDAVRAYGRAAELEPANAQASLGLGIALAKLGRCAEAVQALESARSMRPALYQADYYLWSCYTKLGRSDDARKALERYNAAREQRAK